VRSPNSRATIGAAFRIPIADSLGEHSCCLTTEDPMSSHPRLEDLHATIARHGPGEFGQTVVAFEQAFHDEQAPYYDALHTDREPLRTYCRVLIDDIHRLTHGAEYVVDLCAGTGKSSLPLLERGVRVIAIDVSAEMLRIYRRKAAQYPKLTLIHADATHPPLDANTCPAILMIGGLHHIPDRQLAVANACRALRRGGLLIIHEPVITGRSHWLVPALRNLDALTDLPRVARALRRRMGRLREIESTPDDRLDFTPFERAFTSPEQLTALIPRDMRILDLRSRMILSDCEVGRHLRPLASLIVAVDNWLSRSGRAGWSGNAIWGVFQKP
jgi:ubiquinone/menaquinone biosynthesis C-methylase UbiE